MPRKSAAYLGITTPSPRMNGLQPPKTLSLPERTLFTAIVSNCAADHFQLSDVPLLARYCEASVLAERAAAELRRRPVVEGKPSPWLAIREKAVKEMTTLAMRLRLSPQGRRKQAPPKSGRQLSALDQYLLENPDED